MAYATSYDIQDRLGRELTPEELPLVDIRLEDVERLIKRRIPDLASRITAGTIHEDDLIQVEADSVLRLLRNPDGLFSETDGNYTRMYSTNSITNGRLVILPEEWAVLGYYSSVSVLVPVTIPAGLSPGGSVHPFMTGG
jgi:hypothetical protein